MIWYPKKDMSRREMVKKNRIRPSV